jgi:arylsulfatase A-like enzyme
MALAATLMRRLSVLALLLLAACRPADPRSDVIVIVLDAVRADHLSAYGYGRPTTPRIDQLASDGVLYRRAISAGTWTVTGHASLFTGRVPSSHGAYRAPGGWNAASALDESVTTLAERLGAAGWDTAAFAANEAYLDPVFNLDQGFERYETANLYPARQLADRVVSYLRWHVRWPAFVFMNVLDAHEPYAAPAPYDRLFPGKMDGVGDVNRAYLKTGLLPSPDVLAHCMSQYDGELRYMDDQVKRIFDALARSGRWDNALVVVTADHGELFGEHGMLGHGSLPWDALVHVPLVVKYPGGARRGTVDEPVSLVDVAPTILATLGLPPLPDAQGRPLWERDGLVIAEEHASSGGVARAAYDRDGHVLFEQSDGTARQLALYDLRTDPAQQTPLAADDPRARRLAADLESLVSGLPRAPRGPVPAPDAAHQERLRALGYTN